MEMVIRSMVWFLVAGLFGGGLSALWAAAPNAPGHAGVRSLDVCSDRGVLHQLTGEAAGDGVSLVHRSSTDGGRTWSKPVAVAPEGPQPFALRRGMDAQIAASGSRVFAAWMTAGTDRWGSGPIATALSEDGGMHWSPGPNPSDDGSTTGHGFLDAAFDGLGGVHLVWLDSRDGRQGLRYAGSSDGGRSWGRNRTLKGDSCECCANALAAGPGGDLAVLFRDRLPRDMGLVGCRGGTWGIPETVAPFGWELEGCPHSGGGLAFARSGEGSGPENGWVWRLNAVVWNGRPGSAGVYRVSREWGDGGRWSRPVRMGAEGAVHPDVAASGGRVMMVWSEGEGSMLRGGVSSDGGLTWMDWKPVGTEGRGAEHPRVVRVRGGFRVFWTEAVGSGGAAVGSLMVAD